jgi:hypothetical protein
MVTSTKLADADIILAAVGWTILAMDGRIWRVKFIILLKKKKRK